MSRSTTSRGLFRSVAVEPLEQRRLMAFADVDPSWGTHGVGVGVQAHYEQADGKILATDSDDNTRYLVRLNADGTYDTTFSHDGRVPFPTNIIATRQLTGGDIVVAYAYSRRSPGQSEGVYTGDDDYVYGYGVAKFTARGATVSSFGNNGLNSAAFHSSRIGNYPSVGGVVIDADGSVYFGVSGDSLNVLNPIGKFTSFVLKFDAKGQRDSTYGTDGVVTLPSKLKRGTRNFVRTIDSLDLADNGPLLIGGTELRFDVEADGTRTYHGDRAAASSFVTRLKRSGSDDTAFATAGTFKIDKTIISNGPDDGESAKVIRLSSSRVLLVTRINSRLRVITLTADGQQIGSRSGQQDDTLGINYGEIQFAKPLNNGSLIVVRGGVLYELRPTDSGYVTQAPRLPTYANGKALSVGSYYANTLLPLRDGTVLMSLYNRTVKFDSGDGKTPREDDIPFARQNSITTPGESDVNGDISIPRLDAFFHDDRDGLEYRQRTTAGRWGAVQSIDADANAGVYLSAVGTCVAYTDGTNGDLKFARRRSDGTWKIEVIDRAGSTGLYCSLTRLPDGTFAVAYYDRTRGDLRLARRDANGKWTTQTVDSAGNVGRYAKLIVRPDSGLSVAYATNNTSGFRLADQKAGVTSGGWTFTDLATGNVDVDGLDADYFLTNNDPEPAGPSELTTTVAIYDRITQDLIVAYRPTARSTFTLVREKSSGVSGLNPHVSHYGAGVVSFYDQGRDQVRTTTVVDNQGKFTLDTDPVPVIAKAGPFANPVVSYEEESLYNGYAGGGYTSTYAWVNDNGVLEIRSPV